MDDRSFLMIAHSRGSLQISNSGSLSTISTVSDTPSMMSHACMMGHAMIGHAVIPGWELAFLAGQSGQS